MNPHGKREFVLAEVLDQLLKRTTNHGEEPSFIELVKTAELDPSRDFVGASLRDMDFRGEDLRGLIFL